MDKLISERYAKAFFDLAKEKNKVDIFEKQIKLILKSIEKNEDIFNILNSPNINQEKKKDLFSDIFKESVDEDVINLFFVLIDNKRQNKLIEILNDFIEKVYKSKNIVVCDVISATKLKKADIDKIKNIFERKLNKEIQVKATVDSSLLAGFKIKFGDNVLDQSFKKELKTLKNKLNNISFAK